MQVKSSGTIADRLGLAAAVEFARRNPWDVLLPVLTIHMLVWTFMPALLNANLQLDLAEGLAFGKEWQLVYWKHPPLPWWIEAGLFRLTGDVHVVYILGPLSVVVALWAVWRLGRDMVGAFPALLAALALEGLHFFNFSAVKFSHDPAQLPFWALTGLFFCLALRGGRMLDWALAGLFLALSFWTKYSAFTLAATFGLVLLIDPQARRSWRTAGPYVMAAVFAVVIAPNVWALVDSGFMPFRYADMRATVATHWYQYLVYPLRWIGGQIFFLLPTLLLLATLYLRRRKGAAAPAGVVPWPNAAAFDRRLLAWMALGPFVLTTVIAAVAGRLPVAMWGFPLWTFLPLAAIAWLGAPVEERRLRWFAAAFAAVFVAMPVAYALVEEVEPYLRDRPKATQFPGARVADIVTREFRERTGQPLAYVAGNEFPANTVAVYSPDHPHVIPYGDPSLAPWIDMADVRRRGILLIWEDYAQSLVDGWMHTFPGATVRGRLTLPRLAHGNVAPVRLQYAIVPPEGAPTITIPLPQPQ